jgi:hypothetical protein
VNPPEMHVVRWSGYPREITRGAIAAWAQDEQGEKIPFWYQGKLHLEVWLHTDPADAMRTVCELIQAQVYAL